MNIDIKNSYIKPVWLVFIMRNRVRLLIILIKGTMNIITSLDKLFLALKRILGLVVSRYLYLKHELWFIKSKIYQHLMGNVKMV